MTAIEDPENSESHEEGSKSPKAILKQIHTRLHSRQNSEDDEHKDPSESGSIRKMVQRACRKLHIGKECSLNEDGSCRFDQVEALQELMLRDTTAPISEEEARMIRTCIETMSHEQAEIVESWFKRSPPGYTEQAGDNAEASTSAPGPSRRVASGSHDANEDEHAEHVEQGGDEVEASGSTSRPSERGGSNSHDTSTSEVQHTEHVEQSGDGLEASGSASRPSERRGSNSHDTHEAEHTEHAQQGRDEADVSESASGPPGYSASLSYNAITNEHTLQGGSQAEASGSASRPPRRVNFDLNDSHEEERPDASPAIVKLLKRVRDKLRLS
ncbi:hypothetical protein MMC11_008900 [Xylographa trunciseda]|nr:hypothetical protein [Xylographa trunciseda]